MKTNKQFAVICMECGKLTDELDNETLQCFTCCILNSPNFQPLTIDENPHPDIHFPQWCNICQEVDCSNPDHP